jgi:hypothetical protein
VLDGPVAVGTALAGRPPRRSGRADFPHPAPRSGHRGICGCRLPFVLAALKCPALRPANGRAKLHCPCAAAFPPFPPSQPLLVCSGTSLVLRSGPTAWVCPSSAYGPVLPDAFGAGLLHRCGLLHGQYTQALPIPVHDASVYAQVSDPAEFLPLLPERVAGCCLPCVGTTSALESCTLISGLNTGPAHPLSTLHWRCYHRQRMTRGQGGWLGLPCWGLSPLPPCRF